MITIGRLQFDSWSFFRNLLLAILTGILVSYCMLGLSLQYVVQQIADSGVALTQKQLEPGFWHDVLRDMNRFANNAAFFAIGVLQLAFSKRYLKFLPRRS